jgi:hypothetical protein
LKNPDTTKQLRIFGEDEIGFNDGIFENIDKMNDREPIAIEITPNRP